MSIDKQTSPQAVVEELTGRLAGYRMKSGITQEELAGQAGVSKRTIERIESGCDTQLTTLIRLLQVLGLADRLNQLIPELVVSPMDMLQSGNKPPKRARRKKEAQINNPWKWGDEQ
ncbi:MAG: helix-turn-helix domain-containing protein [Candidatus Hydrogenedentes bacterium]|nr:helix-turn-helix domain-containing protein [Candidatus Hydrogenedentota bacterium]